MTSSAAIPAFRAPSKSKNKKANGYECFLVDILREMSLLNSWEWQQSWGSLRIKRCVRDGEREVEREGQRERDRGRNRVEGRDTERGQKEEERGRERGTEREGQREVEREGERQVDR